MQKVLFALGLYLQIFLFLISCWGWGRTLLRWENTYHPIMSPVRMVLGMGIMICIIQALAIFGYLNIATVTASIGVGFCLALVHSWRVFFSRTDTAHNKVSWSHRLGAEHFALILIMLYAMSLALGPLSPPRAWDELMYHLPHAAEWARSGKLQVNEWLRYPWFPYNFDLLFSAALIMGSDILPHLLHSAAGGITAWLIYQLGTKYLNDRTTAGLATLLWLYLSDSQYEWAYVDMAVSMFILAGLTALLEWHESGTSATTCDRRWIFICAFMVGVAAGIKYQVLALLPLFAVIVMWRDRRIQTWLGITAMFCLPCIYWYARNALMTGDPFNPVGGKFFGFTDWNIHDYRAQFDDLARNVGWPHWSLWAAVALPFLPQLRQKKVLRYGFIVAVYMTTVWATSARYPRYLMFAFPLLALLSATCFIYLVRQFAAWITKKLPVTKIPGRLLGYAVGLMGLTVATDTSWQLIQSRWNFVASSDEIREEILKVSISGYGVWNYLKSHPQEKIYQLGLENAIYYAPHPIWGEVFGPWRYRDYYGLSAEKLHQKLAEQGFTALVIQTERFPLLETESSFGKYFKSLHNEGSVTLYQLR